MIWNDRRTPPNQLTDLSVALGAKYSMAAQVQKEHQQANALGRQWQTPAVA